MLGNRGTLLLLRFAPEKFILIGRQIGDDKSSWEETLEESVSAGSLD